ncbi:MAG: hypothetical protein ABI397_03280 [Candidatus Saccharimonas sp.]
MKKTVLFVPGFQEDINSRNYAKTLSAIKDSGYKVEFININWSRTTVEQWVHELDQVYEKYDPSDTILAGFSFGAVTAFIAATKRSPLALWLFSLSPFFSEDIVSDTFRKSWLKSIGHRRTDSFRKLRFSTLVKSVPTNTIFFYGETELKSWSDIHYRHKIVDKVPNVKETFIPNAKHDVSSDVYIEAIKKELSSRS